MNRNRSPLKPPGAGRVFRILLLLGLLGIASLGAACGSMSSPGQAYSPTRTLLVQTGPTAPGTLPELITVLETEDSAGARVAALAALARMGPDAASAVPAIIGSLDYDNSEVRRRAVVALGAIGPEAEAAVPMLVNMLSNDPSINVRLDIPDTLSQIGEISAVPGLAETLYDDDPFLAVEAAEALASLANQGFGDLGAEDNEEGVSMIVAAAIEWWEEEGRFQDWTD